MVTVVPTSRGAQPSVVRPEVRVLGATTRLLVDQIRSIDDRYVGEMIGLLSHEDYRVLMTAVTRYLDIEL